jgi:hypothetical protein
MKYAECNEEKIAKLKKINAKIHGKKKKTRKEKKKSIPI